MAETEAMDLVGPDDDAAATAAPQTPTAAVVAGPDPPAPALAPATPAVIPRTLGSLDLARADPDAQATVTDFLDFTEHLPSDMMRSLTLIGTLDETYARASGAVHELTRVWGRLPDVAPAERPAPTALRRDISGNLTRALSARVYAHAEATRMAEGVARHTARAKVILAKLQEMLRTYPQPDELLAQLQNAVKSPLAASKSPTLARAPKITLRLEPGAAGDGTTGTPGAAAAAQQQPQQQKVRRQRVPRITVPGEVLAPYELDYDTYSDESESSSESESESVTPPPTSRRAWRVTPQPPRPRGRPAGSGSGKLKIRKPRVTVPGRPKVPKPPKVRPAAPLVPGLSTALLLSKLKPPPENAKAGSSDAPWLQLTQYELAKLRKRMKKNAIWTPSDTMIARELKARGRGIEAYRLAKRKADEEGVEFEDSPPAPFIVDTEVEGAVAGGAPPPPPPPPVEGALSAEAISAEEVQLINRGMKLNEAKKLKRETLARLAAEEAEESARKMKEQVNALMKRELTPSVVGSAPDLTVESASPPNGTKGGGAARKSTTGATLSTASALKRKRGSDQHHADATGGEGGGDETPRPQAKRNKMSTPVPPHHETPIPPPQLTPVPIPAPLTSSASARATTPSNVVTTTTMVPTKPPAPETPIPPPQLSPRRISGGGTSSTSAAAPLQRETRGKRAQQQDATRAATVAAAEPSSSSSTTRAGKKGAALPPINTSSATGTGASSLSSGGAGGGDAGAPSSTTTPGLATRSRTATPRTATPGPDHTATTTTSASAFQRPHSRAGKAASQEPAANWDLPPPPPPPALADRPRRASTARNTPGPEGARPGTSGGDGTGAAGGGVGGAGAGGGGGGQRRGRRPAPGLVSKMSSGGNSAVGTRKAAPTRKKRGGGVRGGPRSARSEGGGGGASASAANTAIASVVTASGEYEIEVELDEDGNIIDPEEARYCLCNRVSFGTMIQCENDGCKQEWFHLECVGLTDVPARTTKWYCPECRVSLGIGEKGEVSARGVKT